MTDNAEREAFKKVWPCHPDVYWHETMKRWVTNGDRLLEAHAYNCRWEGFQAGRAVARAEEPVAYRFTENCGNGKVEYSYYDADKVAGAYRDNCLEITPLYTSPPLLADSVTLREQVAAGDALRISMADVPENILDWASYASEHFQEKYGMQDDADRYKKALSAYDAAISKGETK